MTWTGARETGYRDVVQANAIEVTLSASQAVVQYRAVIKVKSSSLLVGFRLLNEQHAEHLQLNNAAITLDMVLRSPYTGIRQCLHCTHALTHACSSAQSHASKHTQRETDIYKHTTHLRSMTTLS